MQLMCLSAAEIVWIVLDANGKVGAKQHFMQSSQFLWFHGRNSSFVGTPPGQIKWNQNINVSAHHSCSCILTSYPPVRVRTHSMSNQTTHQRIDNKRRAVARAKCEWTLRTNSLGEKQLHSHVNSFQFRRQRRKQRLVFVLVNLLNFSLMIAGVILPFRFVRLRTLHANFSTQTRTLAQHTLVRRLASRFYFQSDWLTR